MQARLGPDRLAFAHEQERIAFGELDADAGRLAGALRDFGIVRGDRVALVLPSGLAFVRFFYALRRLAAVPCAINPSAPPETVARRAGRIRPAAVVVAETMPEITTAAGEAGLRTVVGLELSPRGVAPSDGEPEDLAFLQLTSGTSGRATRGHGPPAQCCRDARHDHQCAARSPRSKSDSASAM